MTLGQEFNGFATTLGEDHSRLKENAYLLCEINMGATAIGTGITTHPEYGRAVLHHLRDITGLDLDTATDLVESTSDTGAFMSFSSTLKRNAIKLSKICNDLRLLSSGPQAGFGEINLPAQQAGSSIMPGKVNPVIPEMVNQVAFSVVGNDITVTMAAEGGQLQLNAFEPIICHGLLQSIEWMSRAFASLTAHCVTGIEVNREHLLATSARSVGVVTALTPYLGYAQAAEIAKTALAGGGDVRDVVLVSGALGADQLDELLRPERLTEVGEWGAALADDRPALDEDADKGRPLPLHHCRVR